MKSQDGLKTQMEEKKETKNMRLAKFDWRPLFQTHWDPMAFKRSVT